MLTQREKILLEQNGDKMISIEQRERLNTYLSNMKLSSTVWFYLCVNNPLNPSKPFVLSTAKSYQEAQRCYNLYVKHQRKLKGKMFFIEEWFRYKDREPERIGKVVLSNV